MVLAQSVNGRNPKHPRFIVGAPHVFSGKPTHQKYSASFTRNKHPEPPFADPYRHLLIISWPNSSACARARIMVAAPSILELSSSRTNGLTSVEDESSWLSSWEQHGWLSMTLRHPTSGSPLKEWLASAVDHQLSSLGAGPRPSYVGSEARDILEDQIYRARMLGFQGLAVRVPSLKPFARGHVLCPEDSAAFLDWCGATVELQVPVQLSSEDGDLAVYRAPIPLGELTSLDFPAVARLTPPPRVSVVAPSALNQAPTLAQAPSSRTLDQQVLDREAPTNHAPANQSAVLPEAAPAPSISRRAAMKSLLEDDDHDDMDVGSISQPPSDLRMLVGGLTDAALDDSHRHWSTPPASSVALIPPTPPAPSTALEPSLAPTSASTSATKLDSVADDASDDLPPANDAVPTSERDQVQASATSASALDELGAHAQTVDHDQHHAVITPRTQASLMTTVPSSASSSVPALSIASASLEFGDDGYADHVENLRAAEGSHGWDGIEHLFETHYLPLQKAVRDGAAPALAAAILAEWAKDFAESYEHAFDAIRNNRGKRPRLVLDVPSYAFQLTRKHEAEHVKLVLVDALRADIGTIVGDKLRLQMGTTAQCVANGLLWSALPANTSAQMELIARGTDGLRHFTGELTEAQLMSRGNDLRRLRPVRVGSHRMYKLDIVQYLARDVLTHTSDNLEQYAAEVATSVGRFLRQQEPSTLVYLFGDHGFGGASEAAPENILTPYQAWLVNG